jgi:hypothetical protein
MQKGEEQQKRFSLLNDSMSRHEPEGSGIEGEDVRLGDTLRAGSDLTGTPADQATGRTVTGSNFGQEEWQGKEHDFDFELHGTDGGQQRRTTRMEDSMLHRAMVERRWLEEARNGHGAKSCREEVAGIFENSSEGGTDFSRETCSERNGVRRESFRGIGEGFSRGVNSVHRGESATEKGGHVCEGMLCRVSGANFGPEQDDDETGGNNHGHAIVDSHRRIVPIEPGVSAASREPIPLQVRHICRLSCLKILSLYPSSLILYTFVRVIFGQIEVEFRISFVVVRSQS